MADTSKPDEASGRAALVELSDVQRQEKLALDRSRLKGNTIKGAIFTILEVCHCRQCAPPPPDWRVPRHTARETARDLPPPMGPECDAAAWSFASCSQKAGAKGMPLKEILTALPTVVSDAI